MNLALHLFRKDFRQFRTILCVWLLILLLDLAANLGWVGTGLSPESLPSNGSFVNVIVETQSFFLMLLSLLIPSAVVLADSPSRREGFLRTRPLPGRDWLLAKALFVIVLIVLPVLIQEWIYLAASGLSAGIIAHGLAERLLYLLPEVVVAAAFASLWRGYSQWVAGLAILVGGTYGVLGLGLLAFYLSGHLDWLSEGGSTVPSTSRYLAALYFAGAILFVFALAHARQAWNSSRRWLGLASGIILYYMVASWWPVNFFKVIPADPAAAQAVVSQSSLKIPFRRISFGRDFDHDHDQREAITASIDMEGSESSFPNVIEWHGGQAKLVNASGQTCPACKPAHGILASSYEDPWQRGWGRLPMCDASIWVGFLPPEAFLRLDMNDRLVLPTTGLGDLVVDPREAWLRDPVTLQAPLEGRVYRWDKVADFPLSTPATLKDADGSWTYLGWHHNPWIDRDEAMLKRSQVAFATTTDARTAPFEGGPGDRFEYLLYNPRRNDAILIIGPYVATRGESTALSQFWLELGFYEVWNGWKPFSQEEMAQCHLLIFQKTWLGTVTVDWQSPPLVINHWLNAGRNPQIPDGTASFNQQGLTTEEIERRVGELLVPGPNASRLEVCHYLLQVVPIMDDARSFQTPGQPIISKLATLVPSHLDVLLEGLPVMGVPSQNAIIQAIIQGAVESQRNQIIAALPTDPRLIEVVQARGWTAAAHDAIYQLLVSPHVLSGAAIHAIGSFHDPSTYPRLVADLETDPSSDVYELHDFLNSLPGMGDTLDESIAREWQSQKQVVPYEAGQHFHQILDLALRARNTNALQFAFRLLQEVNPDPASGAENWSLAQTFRDNFELPGVNLYSIQNSRLIFDQFRKYRPEDFVFDSVRERLVLKP